MLSSGKGYDNYGLILSAATMVPLQGFWNSLVYIRPRYLQKLASTAAASVNRISSSLLKRRKTSETESPSLSSASPQSTGHNVSSDLYPTIYTGHCNDSSNPTNPISSFIGISCFVYKNKWLGTPTTCSSTS